MDTALIISSILGIVTLLLGLSSQLFWWQRKEYRWDRMRSMILSPEGSLLRYPLLFLSFAAVGVGWIVFLWGSGPVAVYAGWVALLAALFHHMDRIRRQGVLRPDWTPKALLAAAVVLFLLTSFFFAAFERTTLTALQWATIHFFLPLLAAAGVGAANAAAQYRKQQIIVQARSLRSTLSHLTVIGITGSAGKTSTKHFTHQILSAAGNYTVATKEHRNSELTVAQDMLEQLGDLSQRTEPAVYIAEMGAYRQGEIAKLAALAKPRIGLVTSISSQHAGLFGGVQKLAQAKWELVRALPRGGIAVLNADDETITRLSKARKGKTVWYSSTSKADVYAGAITIKPKEILATLHVGTFKKQISIPLASDAMLSSVLAAAAVCHALGVPAAKIAAAVGKLQPLPRTMEVVSGLKGSTMLDDSYSASELSVMNALKHLERFPQRKKRVIMVPLIELGSEAARVHEAIGEQLAKSAGAVFIFGRAYKPEISRGIRTKKGSPAVRWYDDPKQLAADATKGIDSDTALLLEGRIPAAVRRQFIPNQVQPRSEAAASTTGANEAN